jgi:hypothetical protein
MAIKVTCSCGATAMVKDEYAGRTGQCRACKAPITVGLPPSPPAMTAAVPLAPPAPDYSQPTLDRMAAATPPAAATRPAPPTDPLFARDTFLLRQKHMAINEKYTVWDEDGTPLLFVERPSYLFRNILALLAGFVAGGTVLTLVGFTIDVLPDTLKGGYALFGGILCLAAVFAIYIYLEKKRHVEFYRNEAKTEKVMRVIQDAKFQLINATYTVTDGAGKLIGTFRKNHLYDIFRKQWECRDSRGLPLFIAREDSIIKSILRRLFGPLLGLLKLDFIYCDPTSGDQLGEFNRSFTILDRYVLNLTQDRSSRIDRRLALAMGVMLDTGEKR